MSLESGELLRGPVLVGADGVRSRVAAALGLREPNYAGYIAYRSAHRFLQQLLQRSNRGTLLLGEEEVCNVGSHLSFSCAGQ